MDNPFEYLKIFPSYKKAHKLQWKLRPDFFDDDPYIFTVQASETVDFSELLFEQVVDDRLYFEDRSNIKQTMTNNLMYRVILQTANDRYISDVVSSEIRDYTRRQFIVASEIARKESLRIINYVGGLGWLLKRKSYGPEVVDITTDPVSGLSLVDSDENQGNHKVGGYHRYIPMHFSIEGGIDVRQLSRDGTGVKEVSSVKARAPGFPLIETNDVIVEKEQDRCWLVKDKQTTFFPGTSLVITQELELSLLSVTDPAYEIEVPPHNFEE